VPVLLAIRPLGSLCILSPVGQVCQYLNQKVSII
jgi:hypothetical protein